MFLGYFLRNQRNKKEAELQTWNSVFFYDVKKFTGQFPLPKANKNRI